MSVLEMLKEAIKRSAEDPKLAKHIKADHFWLLAPNTRIQVALTTGVSITGTVIHVSRYSILLDNDTILNKVAIATVTLLDQEEKHIP